MGFIGWDDGSPVGLDRRDGWSRALGLDGDEERRLTAAGDDTILAGAEGMARLLEQGADAAVCASDTLSIGAFTEVRRRSRDDVDLVGFDDTPVSRTLGLASIRQPVEAVAAAVLDMVLAQLADPDVTHSGLLIEPTLVTHERPDFLLS
ncbi:LacI family transcriptional regulator [Tessaracoccus sp. HDW20]|nr:LacI family transcriptional regulator [Tessaracoccus coleopterorum]